MSSEAERKIQILHAQLVGDGTGVANTEVDKYPGWPTLTHGNGEPRNLTMVDMVREIHRQVQATIATGGRPAAYDLPDDLLGHVLSLRAEVAKLSDEIKARATADVDEAALANELAVRGISGVSAAEMKEILSSVRLTAGQ